MTILVNKTLVLPGGTTEGERYRQDAASRGEVTIGASSIVDDSAASRYAEWVYLPSVHDAGFVVALKEAIKTHKITSVYCPHSIIHEALSNLIPNENLEIKLLNKAPAEIDAERMKTLLERAAFIEALVGEIASKETRNLPNKYEISSLLMYCNTIVGQSSDEKLAAMLALFCDMPAGDIVEIGAFWGRSSFLLTWAAGRYNIGNVLAVDPWFAGNSIQKSSPELVQRDTGLQNWDMIHEGFKVALSVFGPNRVNYLRAPSKNAVKRYDGGNIISNDGYGSTKYTGEISLIHIDGNHDYDFVTTDRDTWCGYVKPGGWIVFDDYEWEHGDGPQRAADEFIKANSDHISKNFVCGKAMFVRLSA